MFETIYEITYLILGHIFICMTHNDANLISKMG